MASNKKIPALNVKIKEYKKSQDNKGIESLIHEPLYQGKYAYLQLNDPKYFKEEQFSFYCKTCLSSIDAKGNKWLIGSLNKGALNNLFNLNFTKDNKPDVETESKWIDEWCNNGCLFILCVNDNPTLSYIVSKTQGYLFEISENTVLPFTKEDKELQSKIDNEIAYQIEHQEAKEDYYENSEAIPAFFFSTDELKRLRIKYTPEYEGEFPDKLKEKIQLPEIELKDNKRNSGKGGGTYNNYMSTQERLDSVLELLEGKNAEKFDLLYAHYVDDPTRTTFALALTGLTINQKQINSNNDTEKINSDFIAKNEKVSNGKNDNEKPITNNSVTTTQNKRGRKPKTENSQENNSNKNSEFNEQDTKNSSYPTVHKFLVEYPSEITENISDEAKQALKEIALESYSEEIEDYLELLSQVLEHQVQGKTYPEREMRRVLIAQGYVSPILCYNTEELEIMAQKIGILEMAETE